MIIRFFFFFFFSSRRRHTRYWRDWSSDVCSSDLPYAITEEFVSVYRLHPLLPDDYEIRESTTGRLIEATDFEPIQGAGTRARVDEYGMSNLLYSFGVANPGAICLKNHPRALSNHVRL